MVVDIGNDLPTLDDFLQQAFADAEVAPEDRMYSILRKIILDDDTGKILNVISVKKKRDNDPNFLEFRGINSLLIASNVNSDSAYEKHRKKAKGYFAKAKALYNSKNNLRNARKLDYILERFDDFLFTLESFYERLRDYVEEAEGNVEQNQEAHGIPEHYLPKKTTATFFPHEFGQLVIDGKIGISLYQRETKYLDYANILMIKVSKDFPDHNLIINIRDGDARFFKIDGVEEELPNLTEIGVVEIFHESYFGALKDSLMEYAEIIRANKERLKEPSLCDLIHHVRNLCYSLNQRPGIKYVSDDILINYCGLKETDLVPKQLELF